MIYLERECVESKRKEEVKRESPKKGTQGIRRETEQQIQSSFFLSLIM